MSGIFKGDSIYKSGGGGGGGFKDGGELVDGDFIKVENNTVSSYDNVSRDPVNFYFEVADGEVLNSVVELTTAVNATINVYVIKNGFYYLLGNVGGNTVNAGNDYNLQIVGNSYLLENVIAGPTDPVYAVMGDTITSICKQNNVIWSGYLNISYGDSFDNTIGVPGRFYRKTALLNDIIPNIGGGWRLATYDEMKYLLDNWTSVQLRGSSPAWQDVPNGDNSSGMNFCPCGIAAGYNSLYNVYKTTKVFCGYWDGRFRDLEIGLNVHNQDAAFIGSDTDGYRYIQCRLVKDI